MPNKIKFEIDYTIVDICKERQINIKTLIKNTTQFIMMIDIRLNDDLNDVLLLLENEYKNDKIKKLTYTYQEHWLKITENQKKSYQKISQEKRVNLLNEIISIAINSTYFNFSDKKIEIKESPIITKYTVDFFLTTKNLVEDLDAIETILKKLHTLIHKKYILPSYYNNLFESLSEYYKINNENKFLSQNYYNAIFWLQEFEKIYFLMITIFNIPMKNKNKYLRSHKSKYEKVLIEKYKNDIESFKNTELNLYFKDTIKQQAKNFLEFYSQLLFPEQDVKIFENNNELFEFLFPDDLPIIIINN